LIAEWVAISTEYFSRYEECYFTTQQWCAVASLKGWGETGDRGHNQLWHFPETSRPRPCRRLSLVSDLTAIPMHRLDAGAIRKRLTNDTFSFGTVTQQANRRLRISRFVSASMSFICCSIALFRLSKAN
jgi:hypothetical protein